MEITRINHPSPEKEPTELQENFEEMPSGFERDLRAAEAELVRSLSEQHSRPELLNTDNRLAATVRQAIGNLARLIAVAAVLAGCDTKFRGPREIEETIAKRREVLSQQFTGKTSAEIEIMADSVVALERAEYLNTIFKPYLAEKLGADAPEIDVKEIYQALRVLGVGWRLLARTDSTLPGYGQGLGQVTEAGGGRDLNWFHVSSSGLDKAPELRKRQMEFRVMHELMHAITFRGKKQNRTQDAGVMGEAAADLMAGLVLHQLRGKLQSGVAHSGYSGYVPFMFVARETLGPEKFSTMFMLGREKDIVEEFCSIMEEYSQQRGRRSALSFVEYVVLQPEILEKLRYWQAEGVIQDFALTNKDIVQAKKKLGLVE